MTKLTWHSGNPPKHLKVRQVYGVIFSDDGRILLQKRTRNNEIKYSLSGGTPEPFDKDMIATLKRELIEEINTEICNDIHLIGYQKVEETNGYAFVQVRMVAMIDKINEKRPDPDTNETYDRILTSPERAIELLNWGEIGKAIITAAVEIAKDKFNLQTTNKTEEFV